MTRIGQAQGELKPHFNRLAAVERRQAEARRRAEKTNAALAGAARELEALERLIRDNRGAIDQHGERRACADPTRFTLSLTATQSILTSLLRIESQLDSLDLQTPDQRYGRGSIMARIGQADEELQPHFHRLLAHERARAEF
jgi:hypothetical protein